MKLSRLLSLVLAVAMLLGVLALNAQAQTAQYPDYSKGFPQQVTIRIPAYDRGFEGWSVTDNYYTRWIQSQFGDKYNVKVEYVSIGRSTEVADFMQMIAAGTAPDIIFHYDMPQAVNYYGEGAIQDLDKNEIAFYAPSYYEKLSPTIDQYGSLDGKTCFFFAQRNPIYYNWVTLIRQDWLDKVGLPMPTNREELDKVAQAWKEAGLGTLGERLLVKSFTFDYAYRGAQVDSKELALYSDLNVAPLTWASAKAYLKTLNTAYNNGTVDPEFYLKKEETAVVADFVAGKTGTYGFYITRNTDVLTSLTANNPDAKVSVLNPAAFAPSDSHPYYYQYPPYGMVMGINSKATPEQRAAIWMLLDWMIQKENLFFLQNGIEGVNYTMSPEGIAVPVKDFAGESKRSNNNNKDYWCLVDEVPNYGDEKLDYTSNLANLAPAGYEDLVAQAYAYDKEIKPYGLINAIFTKPVQSSAKLAADLNALWQELYVKCATCPADQFEATYEQACKDYLEAGYQEILDEKQALLDAGSVK